MHTIVGIGESLWDIFPDRKAIGGAPANFAYHCRSLGQEAYAVTALGRDALGDELAAELDARGLGRYVQRVDYPTGRVLVQLREGLPSYEIKEDVAWDHIAYTEELAELARRCDAVCFGSLAQRSPISAATIQRFIQEMPAGSIKVFDINLRLHYYSREIVEQSLAQATILKLNDEELPVVAQLLNIHGTEQEICHTLLERYALDSLLLTRGALGVNVYYVTGSCYHPALPIEVVDTVGAGDSFAAAYLCATLMGRSRAEAVHNASHLAAYVCSCRGAMPQLPEELC